MNEFRQRNTHVIQFDSIRFIFAISIIIAHHHMSMVNVPLTISYSGMHIFFVMSAFLISRGLLISKNKHTSFRPFFREFYIKRILRIFPVYFLYLFFIIGLAALIFIITHKDFTKVLVECKQFGWMFITFTYNFREGWCLIKDKIIMPHPLFSHLWSLSLEEQFYFFIPFAIFFLTRKQLIYLSIFIIILIPTLRIYYSINYIHTETDELMKGIKGYLFYRASLFQLDCFFYGILLAVYPFKPKLKLYKILLWMVAILFFGLLIANGIIVSNEFSISFFEAITRYDFLFRNYQDFYFDTFSSLFIAIVFLNCFYNPNFLSFFNTKLIQYIGNKLTYSSYVYQFLFIIPIKYLLHPLLQKYIALPEFILQIITVGLSVTLIYLLSYLSYELMEKKLLKYKIS